ncbi:hypothetical protein HZS_3601 [Henneguya salminicola]|nr:hypothetical protein HZS_3601 [Henneguya salminicola]
MDLPCIKAMDCAEVKTKKKILDSILFIKLKEQDRIDNGRVIVERKSAYILPYEVFQCFEDLYSFVKNI